MGKGRTRGHGWRKEGCCGATQACWRVHCPRQRGCFGDEEHGDGGERVWRKEDRSGGRGWQDRVQSVEPVQIKVGCGHLGRCRRHPHAPWIKGSLPRRRIWYYCQPCE